MSPASRCPRLVVQAFKENSKDTHLRLYRPSQNLKTVSLSVLSLQLANSLVNFVDDAFDSENILHKALLGL